MDLGAAPAQNEVHLEAITWKTITVRLGDLKPWAENPKTITKAAAKRLLASWKEYGQVQTIAISPSLVVLDGHQRLNVLLAAYGSDYVIDARQASRELSEDEQKRLVVLLHAGAVGSWDWDSLSGWSASDLMEWGMDAEALAGWKRDVAALGNLLESEKPTADAEPQVDRAAELLEKWQVKPGDLWRIGDHRLLCGDSTKREDVERVMGGEKADMVFTDPPYGMFLSTAMSAKTTVKDNWVSHAKKYDAVIGDNDDFKPELISTIFSNFNYCKEVFIFGADYFSELLPNKNEGSWFVWDKRAGIEDMKWSTSEFELLWSKEKHQRKIARITWSGILGTEQEKDHSSGRMHPTQKPTKLSEWFINQWCAEKGVVVDLYAGAGFTLVACENLHRRCRAIEISPAYCSVILERMATAFPELTIERITS